MSEALDHRLDMRPVISAGMFRGDSRNEAIFSKLIDIRTDFVKKMNWLPGRVSRDGDEYDSLAQTMHVYCEDQDGEIAATMRLTEAVAARPDEMLSVTMLASNPNMHAQALKTLEDLYAEDTKLRLLDLTRLAFRSDINPEQMPRLMMEMFVLAMNNTAPIQDERSRSTVWGFAVMGGMNVMLNRMGIESTKVAAGRVSEGDGYVTVFGYIRPYEATHMALRSFSPKHALAKEAIQRGLPGVKSL